MDEKITKKKGPSKQKPPKPLSVLELFVADKASYERAALVPADVKKEIARSMMMGKKEWWYLYKTYKQSNEALSSVCYNPSGTSVATASDDDRARIVTVETGKEKVFVHTNCVLSVSFHPSGNYLATGSADLRTCIWDIRKKNIVASCHHNQSATSVCFNSLGNLASVSWDGQIHIFDNSTDTGFTSFIHGPSACSVCFHPRGKYLATGAVDHTARLFEMIRIVDGDMHDISLDEIASFRHSRKSGKSVATVCFNPLGTLLATGSDNCKVRIWDIQTGEKVSVFKHDDAVNSVQFDPLGNNLLTASCDCRVRIFDICTGKQLTTLIHRDDVFSACYHPSGNQLATGSMDGNLYIFNKYTDYTLEQLLLKKMIFTWVLIEKPDKKIVHIKNFLTDVAYKHKADRKEIFKLWNSFPRKVRTDLWSMIQHYITKYGKKEKKEKQHKKKFLI